MLVTEPRKNTECKRIFCVLNFKEVLEVEEEDIGFGSMGFADHLKTRD